MNIKSILRNIRFLALLIGNMMMAGCSNSDKPAYLEPHLITTEATHITRTEATLNGSATIEGETEMPKLLFRYGTSESMNLNTSEVHAQGADVSLVLTGLKAGTTKAVADAVAEVNPAGPKDMGRVVKAARAALAGKTIDGGKLAGLVKAELNK